MIRISDPGKPVKVDISVIHSTTSPSLAGKRFLSIDTADLSIILDGFDGDAANRALEIAEALTAAARVLMRPPVPVVEQPERTMIIDDGMPF